MDLFNKNKKEVESKTYSNRRESIKAENNFNVSLEQWDKVKTAHLSKVEKMLYEREIDRRKKDALVKKKKIFLDEMAKKDKEETEGFSRRFDIGQKVNDKKRWELKKRDILYRNKSIFG